MEHLPIDMKDLTETFKEFGLWEKPLVRVSRIYRKYLDESPHDFKNYFSGKGFKVLDFFYWLKNQGYSPSVEVHVEADNIYIVLEDIIVNFTPQNPVVERHEFFKIYNSYNVKSFSNPEDADIVNYDLTRPFKKKELDPTNIF